MRKLIYAINITLDGNCDHMKMIGDDEILAYFTQLMQDIDVQVFGRKTYELMVPYWPDVAKNPAGETQASIDFAEKFESTGKIVFSRTLEHAEGNAKIVRGGLRDEILKLKKAPGKNIMAGGVDLASQIIQLGLVDEYYFVVHPIVAGEGVRLLGGVSLPEKLRLKLAESKILKSGCAALHYVKA